MLNRPLNLFLAFPSYGGNGGLASEHPAVRDWAVNVYLAKYRNGDDRIGTIASQTINDTPITMVRNRFVQQARSVKADVLVMIDSDMEPDYLVDSDPAAKPFFESSFDFLCNHYERGPVAVAAPYCGPPPHENVYVFQWTNSGTDPANECDMGMAQYTRSEAARMAGIHPIGAAPTGLIMYDMRLFDLFDYPYFDYEWENDGAPCLHCGQREPGERAHKASTEDVQSTRDMALCCYTRLGYNPLFCNWDAWAIHWKPKPVGKPSILTVDQIGERMAKAVKETQRGNPKTDFLRYDNDSRIQSILEQAGRYAPAGLIPEAKPSLNGA